MSTAVVFNGVTYSVPNSGETNWSSLSNYLIALAANSQTTNKQIAGIRTATSSPVAMVAATDYCVVTNMTVPGAVAVTLPTGVNGQILVVVDGKGDAGINNVTVSGNGGQQINGAATFVINQPRGAVIVQFSTTEGQWIVLASLSGGGGSGTTFPVRTALTSPVTVTVADFCIMTNLTVPGAVAVNLPAGVDGALIAIVDAKGDALTNNITITPNSGLIQGASTLVLNRNNSGVLIQYNTTETQWKVLGWYLDSGVTPILNGGTGQTTANAALNALLPSQATNSGKALTTNGTNSQWSNVLTDPTTTRGDLIRRGASSIERFAAVTNNQVVRGNGTDVVSGSIDDPGFFTTGAAAGSAAIGIVTTAAQSFAGLKEFQGGLRNRMNVNAGTSTVTLTVADNPYQTFTAATTVVLPTTSVLAGQLYLIQNTQTSDVTINASGGTTVEIVRQGSVLLEATQDTPTTNAHWRIIDLVERYVLSTTFTWNGTGGNTGAQSVKFVRRASLASGSTITMTIPQLQATSGTSSTSLDSSASTAAPSRFRPSATTTAATSLTDNNAASTSFGLLQMDTSGFIFIGKAASVAFTNANTAGARTAATLTYVI